MKKKSVIGTFDGKCCDATVANNNDMLLQQQLFANLFNSDEYKRALQLGHYIGFLGHPDDPGCMDFEHACIIMKECHMDDNGEIYGTFDLVDTPVGRIVKAFIDGGVQFGISIRGAGDVAGDGTVDPETFVFRGFDLVAFPAYDDAIPKFQEIAASSDIDNQVKYKKVCVTVNKNLDAIKSATTLSTIQSQFNEASDEYKVIQNRKSELDEDDEDNGSDEAILQEKIKGMTKLFIDEVAACNELRRKVSKLQQDMRLTDIKCSRKIQSIKRITASQIDALSAELDNTQAKQKTLVAANTKLKSSSEQLKLDNLKYVHKIKASSELVTQKDSIISELKAKLRKTVTASSTIENRASNLDDEVKNLNKRILAAEQMILAYQQSYANMYANALGAHLEDLPVTATTSVSELKSMITSGTSTANIAAAPSADIDPIEEVVDEVEEDSIVTL